MSAFDQKPEVQAAAVPVTPAAAAPAPAYQPAAAPANGAGHSVDQFAPITAQAPTGKPSDVKVDPAAVKHANETRGQLADALQGNMQPHLMDDAAIGKLPADQQEAARAKNQAEKDRCDTMNAHLKAMPDEQKKQILDRTKGLTGEALVKEMAAIEAAMQTKNADRALGAYADIAKMAKTDGNGARITPDIMGQLVTGVAAEKHDGGDDRGILGRDNARDAARTVMDMSRDDYRRTQQLLNDAKGDQPEDTQAQQAMILKAVATKRDQVGSMFNVVAPNPGGFSFDKSDVEQFAGAIRGMKKDDLIKETSVRELQQQYANTCAQTTGQITRAEADPMYAMSLVGKNLQWGMQHHIDAGDEQKTLHEATPGAEVRDKETDKARDNVYATLRKMDGERKADPLHADDHDKVTDAQTSALRDLMSGKLEPPPKKGLFDFGTSDAEKKWDEAHKALELVRKHNDGQPDDTMLLKMQNDSRSDAKHKETSVGTTLDSKVSPTNHLDYKTGTGPDGKPIYGEGVAGGKNDKLDAALQDGQTVPISVAKSDGTGGHSMSISDVRENKDGKQYLVQDPWSGKSKWIPERQLQNGDFTDLFGLNEDGGHRKMTDVYVGK
jgi:hypothetical protein